MHCPTCSSEVPDDTDNCFCEECGAALAAPAPDATGCVCGAGPAERDEDGFCLRCGRRLRLPVASDHVEQSLSPEFAAVSDRGLRHDHNEDRFGIATQAGNFALVVCDGVSTSKNSEIAAAAVTEAVLEFASKALAQSPIPDAEQILRQAITAGVLRLETKVNSETRRMTGSRKLRRQEENPASSTVVAALVIHGVVTLGWVGDSRAYWIDAQSAWPLTRDHSWQNEVVSAGEMTQEQAAKSPKAHAITRWIGPDTRCEPDFASRTLTQPGTLLLCTDGLWNYAASPDEMAALVRASDAPGKDALALAQSLIAFALERGGNDNITVSVLRVAGSKPESPGSRK